MTWPVAERTWFVSNDDEYISRCLECGTTLMIGASKDEMDALWIKHCETEHLS